MFGPMEPLLRLAARRGERGCHKGVELLAPDSNTAFTVGVRCVRGVAARHFAASVEARRKREPDH